MNLSKKVEYLFICVNGCGGFKPEAMNIAYRHYDPTLVCPNCGRCEWYIEPKKVEREENPRLWCTKCDVDMVKKGIALDCPEDGLFYQCLSCNYRIVIFKKRG
ncbi:hypothetical protein ES707_02306 [subsurface metagenome]|jgi:predicted RNA-binding Zn-ribbon protein involved in translation (DUF1610 family)